MNRIYYLLGEAIHELQKMETALALLLFSNYVSDIFSQTSILDFKKSALAYWSKIDKETMGVKLREVIKKGIFAEKSDIEVFNFLKEKRNYLVHDFFVVNDCSSKDNVEKCEKELQEIISWCSLINKALKKMVQETIPLDF